MTRPNPRLEREKAVKAAARALYERDAKRSIGLAGEKYVYPRVEKEYEAQARTALDAAGRK